MINSKEKYSKLIKAEAKRLGFLSCGISKAEFLEEEAPKLENWLKKGYHGEMNYMENHFDMRLDPTKLVADSKSVISLGYNYFPAEIQTQDSFKIAKYAYGQDYHHVIKTKLKELTHFIESEIGTVSGRAFVDSAPVLERAWAKKSGIAWEGKHSLMLKKQEGSFFFLSELIIDLDLEYDMATTDHCGSCTQCVDACPTEAILSNNIIDGSKCISYLTIELKNDLPAQFKGKMEDWMFGCDICQDVCPWNRFSTPHNEPLFNPKPQLLSMAKKDWTELTQEVFSAVFQKSAVKRTKFSGLTRNIEFLKD